MPNNIIEGRQPENRGHQALYTNGYGALVTERFSWLAAMGKLPGVKTNTKFGRVTGVGTGDTPVDVWHGATLYTGFPTGAPETLTLTSTSDDDASGQSGMQTIRIYGLKSSDSTYEEYEDITLNGTSGVTTTSTWYRVYRAYGTSFGSGETNAGDITIQHSSTTANIFAVLPTGFGQTQIAAFTIPSGVEAYISSLTIFGALNNGGDGAATVSLMMREFGSGGYRSLVTYQVTNGSSLQYHFDFPIKVPAKADLVLRVRSVSDANTIVSGTFGVIILDNTGV